MPASGGAFGVACLEWLLLRAAPPKPPRCWPFPSTSGKAGVNSLQNLATWLESHPQREDLYAALRPLLAERPRQDRTFLDEIDQLQAALRTAQLR